MNKLLIKKRIFSPKARIALAENKLTFNVDVRLTKPQIRTLMQRIYNVRICSVNTHILPVKKRRVKLKNALGPTSGYKSQYKRAIIRLQKDQWDFLPKSKKMSVKNEGL